MAIILGTFNLPPTNLEEYGRWASESIDAVILKAPGIRTFRAFRNLLPNSPDVLVMYEFDSTETALHFIRSAGFIRTIAEAKAMGVTDLNTQLWDVSPVVPEPRTP